MYSATSVIWTPWRPTNSVLIIKIFQVSLCTKGHFGTLTKYLEYAGVLVIPCSLTKRLFHCKLINYNTSVICMAELSKPNQPLLQTDNILARDLVTDHHHHESLHSRADNCLLTMQCFQLLNNWCSN